MRRSALVAAGVIFTCGAGSWTAAQAKPAPVTEVTATITCASGTSADVIITPVDANDEATGASLTVGCGQYGPSDSTEAVTAGTTQWNYGGFYYPIGATGTTSLVGRVSVGKTVRASMKGARATFTLAAG